MAFPASSRLTHIFILSACALSGCVGRGLDADMGPVRTIDLAAFADPSAVSSDDRSGSLATSTLPTRPAQPDSPADHSPVRLGAGDPEVAAAWEAPFSPPPPAPGERVYIDRMVGQVNGRPIFAQEFFTPLDDQLAQLGQDNRQQPRRFVSEAYNIIASHLREIVLDQLFLAEAEAGLSEQEQQGVRYFLTQLEEQLVLEGEGSRTQIESELLEQQGVTLEGYLDERRREILISQVYRENVLPRVIVSWRDVEREYNRRYDEFNPPAEVLVHRIRLHTTREAEKVTDVQSRLDRGETFQRVAASLGVTGDDLLWGTFKSGAEGFAEIEIESIRERMESLAVGETSQPFEVGGSTWWLHIAEIRRPPATPLYDPALQRKLQEQIFQKRQSEEQQAFIRRLFERGVFDELEEMISRLTDMAVRRYLTG